MPPLESLEAIVGAIIGKVVSSTDNVEVGKGTTTFRISKLESGLVVGEFFGLENRRSQEPYSIETEYGFDLQVWASVIIFGDGTIHGTITHGESPNVSYSLIRQDSNKDLPKHILLEVAVKAEGASKMPICIVSSPISHDKLDLAILADDKKFYFNSASRLVAVTVLGANKGQTTETSLDKSHWSGASKYYLGTDSLPPFTIPETLANAIRAYSGGRRELLKLSELLAPPKVA